MTERYPFNRTNPLPYLRANGFTIVRETRGGQEVLRITHRTGAKFTGPFDDAIDWALGWLNE